jgi:hypothetical protein
MEMISYKAMQKKLQNDPLTYTESVGQSNKQNARAIFSHPDGKGTVIRLFFGATRCMPVRGLSYVTAAQNIAAYIPHEQLQIVFAHDLGSRVNDVPKDTAREQAKLLREVMRRHIEAMNPQAAAKVAFVEDTPEPLMTEIEPGMAELIGSDNRLHARLSDKSSKHGNNYAGYGAAHVVLQETGVSELVGLTGGEPAPVTPERLVSIGCQQEHLFYDLRNKARTVLTDLSYVPTAQIFTKHVLPPYYLARGNGDYPDMVAEQTLESALSGGLDMAKMVNLSAKRDVNYLLTVMPCEEIKI